jgi:hypothetical protein
VLTGALAASGCGTPPAPGADPTGDARDSARIGAFERPEALVGDASRRLADNISAADVGHTFGVPSGSEPYPDTYWPFIMGGTDLHWSSRDPRSPLEKYMLLADPYELAEAKVWEFRYHGPGEPGVATWHGHCPGWSAAATTNPPILHPVLAGVDLAGRIRPCREGELGCIRFEIGDVNALMAEIYLDGPLSLIGTKCNMAPYAIPRDRNGRILVAGCDGVNAGSLLIAAATLLKRHRIAFVMDVQRPNSTDQIWNQPTYAYHVHDFRPLTRAAAANLVAHGSLTGPETEYRWSSTAQGFAFVDLELRFVGEMGPNLLMVPGTRSTYGLRMAAVIELDADATDPRASILGGEYLDLPAVHADRLDVAPYMWVSHGPGPEYLPAWVGTSHHNPYVRPSVVQQLVALGQQ